MINPWTWPKQRRQQDRPEAVGNRVVNLYKTDPAVAVELVEPWIATKRAKARAKTESEQNQ